ARHLPEERRGRASPRGAAGRRVLDARSVRAAPRRSSGRPRRRALHAGRAAKPLRAGDASAAVAPPPARRDVGSDVEPTAVLASPAAGAHLVYDRDMSRRVRPEEQTSEELDDEVEELRAG